MRSPSGSDEKKKKKKKNGEEEQQMAPASVMVRLILMVIWRQLIRNPNTYASILGLLWSFTSFRYSHTPPHPTPPLLYFKIINL